MEETENSLLQLTINSSSIENGKPFKLIVSHAELQNVPFSFDYTLLKPNVVPSFIEEAKLKIDVCSKVGSEMSLLSQCCELPGCNGRSKPIIHLNSEISESKFDQNGSCAYSIVINATPSHSSSNRELYLLVSIERPSKSYRSACIFLSFKKRQSKKRQFMELSPKIEQVDFPKSDVLVPDDIGAEISVYRSGTSSSTLAVLSLFMIENDVQTEIPLHNNIAIFSNGVASFKGWKPAWNMQSASLKKKFVLQVSVEKEVIHSNPYWLFESPPPDNILKEMVKRLVIKCNIAFCPASQDSFTELMLACGTGSIQQVKKIFELNPQVKVNAKQSTTGNTALHLAVAGNFPEIVKELSLHGANWTLANWNGITPIHVYQYYQRNNCEMLFDEGLMHSHYDRFGFTPADYLKMVNPVLVMLMKNGFIANHFKRTLQRNFEFFKSHQEWKGIVLFVSKFIVPSLKRAFPSNAILLSIVFLKHLGQNLKIWLLLMTLKWKIPLNSNFNFLLWIQRVTS